LNIIKYKEREQEQDLDLKTKMSKYMANASFYRLKFRTIDLMTNYWGGDHLLTWWQPLSSCLNKMALLKFWPFVLAFQQKKNEFIWTSRTQDMGWTLNNEQCLGYMTNSDFSFVATIWTWTRSFWILDSHENVRPMS